MPKKQPKTLNLLDPSLAPKTAWDKVYEWVFNVGRYIIVSVELVVLVAFASRFILDQKNNDLKEGIEAKVEILQAQRGMETEIRGVQNVLNNISGMIENQDSMSEVFSNVLDKVPPDVAIDNLTIDVDSAVLVCRASSYERAEDLEKNFRGDPAYENVTVSLTRSGSATSEVNFTLTIIFGE